MEAQKHILYTGFAGYSRFASGDLAEVVRKARERVDQGENAPILIFEDETGSQIDIDIRGASDEGLNSLLQQYAPKAEPESQETVRAHGPGRPRLGVVCREVSLLPRHWDWLSAQPGGASVALRKLVEEAKRKSQGKDRARKSREAAYKFMTTMAGDLPGFEEATRFFFAGNDEGFEQLIQPWPEDIRDHCRKLVQTAAQYEKEALAQQ